MSSDQARFPLDGTGKFISDSKSEIQAEIRYGDSRLDIAATADVAAASIGETAAHLWLAHTMGVVGKGGC